MALANADHPISIWNANHSCSKLGNRTVCILALLGFFLAQNHVAAVEANLAEGWKLAGPYSANDLLCNPDAPVWSRRALILRSVTR